MPNITVCPQCGCCYEACTEEVANSSDRLCKKCYEFFVKDSTYNVLELTTLDMRKLDKEINEFFKRC